ncbi:sulfur carrier protein ThiS [Poriferisphaera sp. WC338]|uniref:sulfur carrier protein ThiS n=1 Tax=Poriferisphaera sp. WC338 TaxID=3425129 RepID=UPI003D81BDFA
MKLIINGEEREIAGATVREVVVELGLGDQPVAVEVNKAVVPKRKHEETMLNEGDVLELVTLVGGG